MTRRVTDPEGKRIPFTDFKTLDLRKWDTKGLAFIDYDGPSGKGRIRIDGLTYGGFKKENDEPAERLMRRIRSRFSGEIIEYAPVTEHESDGRRIHPGLIEFSPIRAFPLLIRFRGCQVGPASDNQPQRQPLNNSNSCQIKVSKPV